MDTPSSEVTQMLLEWSNGKKEALDQLLPILYRELKDLASGYLREERAGHTLQPTALIHEAYLRLIVQETPEWQSRSHFFGVAARLMRQILVDHARRHRAGKRGGDQKKVSLEDDLPFSQEHADAVVALDEALRDLATFDERKSRVLEMRYFAGMSPEETAAALGISEVTVRREMRLAKAWLHRELEK